MQKNSLLVANKADVEGADGALEYLQERYGRSFHIASVSAATGEGLDALGASILAAMHKVRVYLKSRGSLPDLEAPLVMREGSRVEDAARLLHKEWVQKLKYSLLWGSGKFKGQLVRRDHVLSGGDIIELHS